MGCRPASVAMELHHNMYPDADPFTDVRPNTEKIGCFLDGKGLLLFLLHRRATHALPTLVERNLPRFNETHGWAVQATRKRTATHTLFLLLQHPDPPRYTWYVGIEVYPASGFPANARHRVFDLLLETGQQITHENNITSIL